MVGSDVFDGTELTTALAAEDACAEPALFVAVTTTNTVEPASAEPSVYEELVAPSIALQFKPD